MRPYNQTRYRPSIPVLNMSINPPKPLRGTEISRHNQLVDEFTIIAVPPADIAASVQYVLPLKY